MMIAACDPERYRIWAPRPRLLRRQLASPDADWVATDAVPQPVNVFMNIPVGPEGDLSWLGCVSRRGIR